MFSKFVSIAVCGLFTAHVGAVALSPIAQPTTAELAIDPSAANIPCDQITQAFGNFNAFYVQHNDAMDRFLGQLVDKLTEWQTQLQPLEGSANAIPVGTFSVLQDGASKIDNLKTAAGDNVTLLSTELARIQDSLSACQILPLSHKK